MTPEPQQPQQPAYVIPEWLVLKVGWLVIEAEALRAELNKKQEVDPK